MCPHCVALIVAGVLSGGLIPLVRWLWLRRRSRLAAGRPSWLRRTWLRLQLGVDLWRGGRRP